MMSSGNEENKIERSFSKKIEIKKEEVIMSNIAVMEEQKQITIKPKRIYKKKALIAEEPQPLSEAGEFFQQPDEEEIVPVPVPVEEEEDEEAILIAKLAEVKQKKAIAQAKENISELREELRLFQKGLIDKAAEQLKLLQDHYLLIGLGFLDEELIAKATQPKSSKTERTTDRVVSAVGEGKFRQQATINLNTKYDSFKKKLLGGGQFTERINGYNWTLYGKAEHLVATKVVEGKRVYFLPTFKEVPAMLGGEKTFETNKDLRDWIKAELL